MNDIEFRAEQWMWKNWPQYDTHKQGCTLEGLAGQAETGLISMKFLCAILREIASKMK